MSLKGSLQTVALPEVLEFLSGTAKTGELRVDGTGTEGLIWFEEGSIAAVRVRRGPNPVEAVFQLLRIDEGEFSFNAGESRPEDVAAVERSEGTVSRVLSEAQERLRQWAEIVSVVPSLDHRVSLTPTAPGDTVSLESSQWALVVAIGEGHTVGHVLAARDLGEFEGCQAIKGLIEASLVEIGDPVPAADAFAGPATATAPEADPVPVVEDREYADALETEPTSIPAPDPVAAAPNSNGQSDFGVFGGFGGFGSGGYLADGSVPEADIPGSTVADGPVEVAPEAASLISPEVDPDAAFPVYAAADEPATAHVDADGDEPVDRYASLRSVMAEVGQSLEDDPSFEDAPYGDEDPAMPAFGSPRLYPALAPQGEHDQEHPEAAGDPTDGHAALHALLAEVSNDEPASDGEEGVDGLADRGPWTNTELASFDGWRREEAVGLEAADGGFDATGPQVSASEESSVADAAEPPVEAEVDEDPAPVEEPINRGLLLKFLSSVRN